MSRSSLSYYIKLAALTWLSPLFCSPLITNLQVVHNRPSHVFVQQLTQFRLVLQDMGASLFLWAWSSLLLEGDGWEEKGRGCFWKLGMQLQESITLQLHKHSCFGVKKSKYNGSISASLSSLQLWFHRLPRISWWHHYISLSPPVHKLGCSNCFWCRSFSTSLHLC